MTNSTVANAASTAASSFGLLPSVATLTLAAGAIALGSFTARGICSNIPSSQSPSAQAYWSYRPFTIETADHINREVFESWSPEEQDSYSEAASACMSQAFYDDVYKADGDRFHPQGKQWLQMASEEVALQPWRFREYASLADKAICSVV